MSRNRFAATTAGIEQSDEMRAAPDSACEDAAMRAPTHTCLNHALGCIIRDTGNPSRDY